MLTRVTTRAVRQQPHSRHAIRVAQPRCLQVGRMVQHAKRYSRLYHIGNSTRTNNENRSKRGGYQKQNLGDGDRRPWRLVLSASLVLVGAGTLVWLMPVAPDPPRRGLERAPTTLKEPESEPTPSPSPGEQSPFKDPALEEGIQRRMINELQLQSFIQEGRKQVADLQQRLRQGLIPPDEFDRQLARIQRDASALGDHLLYGPTVSRDQRKTYLERYGCARWTDRALETVASLSPLIEIGAGSGHWQRALSEMGASVLAFDNQSELQPTRHLRVGDVELGDHNEVQKYPDRTLFLCYPPPGDMAEQCLERYRGNTVVYVGEGRGGVNGRDELFDMLERDFTVREIQDLDPFPECFERLYVLDRRPKKQQDQ